MKKQNLWAFLTTGVAVSALMAGAASAQGLSGSVASAAEPTMEGVLVSAKKEGSTIAVTVVTDAQGKYAFPADRLSPGKYNISIRAIGYVLEGAKTTEVPEGKAGAFDIKLAKTKNIAAQLSNGEWLLSMPGADKDKQIGRAHV